MADGAATPAPGASDSLPARACKVNKPYRLFYHYNGKNSTYLFWIVDFEGGKDQEHRGVRAGKRLPCRIYSGRRSLSVNLISKFLYDSHGADAVTSISVSPVTASVPTFAVTVIL